MYAGHSAGTLAACGSTKPAKRGANEVRRPARMSILGGKKYGRNNTNTAFGKIASTKTQVEFERTLEERDYRQAYIGSTRCATDTLIQRLDSS